MESSSPQASSGSSPPVPTAAAATNTAGAGAGAGAGAAASLAIEPLPSPPPRNSMEDEDASVKRKRPRLDSGQRVYQSMGTAELSPSPAPSPEQDSHHHDDGNSGVGQAPSEFGNALDGSASAPATPGPELGSEPTAAATAPAPAPAAADQLKIPTPSKMTLSLRDSTGSLSSSKPSGHGDGTSEESGKPSTSNLSDSRHGTPAPGSPNTLLSEGGQDRVVEPENAKMQTPTEEIVAELSGGRLDEESHCKQWLEDILNLFPVIGKQEDWPHAFIIYWEALVAGPTEMIGILVATDDWLQSYLREIKTSKNGWTMIYSAEPSFWLQFSHILRAAHRPDFAETLRLALEIDASSVQPVIHFLSTLIDLTTHFLLVDRHFLQEMDTDSELVFPDYSAGYLPALAATLCNTKLLAMLKTTIIGQANPSLLAPLQERLGEEDSFLGSVSEYCRTALEKNRPDVGKSLVKLFELSASIANIWLRDDIGNAQQRSQTGAACFRLFTNSSMHILLAVRKQFAIINIELFSRFIDSMTSMLTRLTGVDNSILSGLTSESIADTMLGLSSQELRLFIAVAWGLDFLDKCVRSGRMEIRIAALERLSSILVDVYKEHIHTANELDHPVVQWASLRLRDSKIISYLLGPDSHTQLISRSQNIIGFLAASHTYSNEQTDLIWDSIQSSEDPRRFEAIVSALKVTLTLLDAPALLYLCRKFLEMSALDFGSRNRALLSESLGQLQRCWDSEQTLDLSPFQVLLRLARDAGSDASLSPERRLEIWSFVRENVRLISSPSWDSSQRLDLYLECLKDFEARSDSTNGSCLVINRLLDKYGPPDLDEIAQHVDLVRLIVEEFCRLKQAQPTMAVNFEVFHDPLKERLQLLQKTLLWSSDQFPSELSLNLWEAMVGNNAVGMQARSYAWETLADLTYRMSSKSAFLEIGIVEFLPELSPDHFSRPSLAFAHRLADYQSRVIDRMADDLHLTKSSQTQDTIFWQLALDSNDEQLASGAIKSLVDKVVLEDTMIRSHNLSAGQKAFIQKAITELIHAASDKSNSASKRLLAAEDTDLVARADDKFQKKRSHRALLMLKQLNQALRASQQQLPPSERSESESNPRSIHGEAIEIKYQTSDRGVPSLIKTLEIGDKSTINDLADWLRARTGFAKFNLIVGGQRVDQELNGSVSLCETSIVNSGALLVHKIPGSESSSTKDFNQSQTPFEREVMQHFHALYDLLSHGPEIGAAMLDFLVCFSPHQDIVDNILRAPHSNEPLLPADEPYKLVYLVTAMKFALQRQLSEGCISDSFMVHSVSSLVRALTEHGKTWLSDHSSQPVPLHIIFVLHQFLKERVSTQISSQYFSSPEVFVNELFTLCINMPLEQARNFNQAAFAVLLEGALLNSGIWSQLKSHSTTLSLFKLLLLQNPVTEIRIVVQKTVLGILAALPHIDDTDVGSKAAPQNQSAGFAFDETSFLIFVWKNLILLLPESAEYASQCEQFFELLQIIFIKLSDLGVDTTAPQENLSLWLNILLCHRHTEEIGQGVVDQFAKGLSLLIHQCLLYLKREDLQCQVELSDIERLFSSYLFPPITEVKDRESQPAIAPILTSDTRRALCQSILLMSRDEARLHSCVIACDKVLAEIQDPANQWSYDREKHIRSAAGYPGLINLSNTCYLNSLMTQLFMNIRFRAFILSLTQLDPAKQRLIVAIRQLFADMQDGWSKAILTQELAESIETYEGPLDPTIQMDADEAFNLIFDRIEGQLNSASDRVTFRNIFGGQIVQQIKSRECVHISERLEPVTAIQCDIQGKNSLEESLRSYIEGEMMEGDNKYKCSTCDRYVNAVKRACLRKPPDNLIFHLKRFDFDLVQGTRNKLNDWFTFPERINMAPYNDKHLEASDDPKTSDNFLLTGVLVHSGTAELGHYYSFIRARPVKRNSWIEFNDADVSYYDARAIRDHCFGGESRDQFTGAAFPKMYNAYMLFYQRESSIGPEDEHYQSDEASIPLRTKVPLELAKDLAMRNEVIARTYCLFDSAHVTFLKGIQDLRSSIDGIKICSKDHLLETDYIRCLWNHILDVFGREHQRQGCNEILSIIEDMMKGCIHCCKSSLIWLLSGDDTRLRFLLLRQPETSIRLKIGSILHIGLSKIKNEEPESYLSVDSGMMTDHEIERPEMLKLAVENLSRLQKILSAHPRAWVDFYDLLTAIADLGAAEKICMHNMGVMGYAIDLLLIDNDHDWGKQFPIGYGPYIKALEKRQFNLTGLARYIGSVLPFFSPTGDLSSEDGKYVSTISSRELSAITFQLRSSENNLEIPAWFERLANADSTIVSGCSALRNVIRWAVHADDAIGITRNFENLIQIGLEKSPASLAEPYLHMSLAFIEASNEPARIERLIQNIALSIPTIGPTGGLEHLDFLKRARVIINPEAYPDRPDQAKLLVTTTVHVWAATLLTYTSDNVGEKSRLLIEELLFPDSSDVDDEELTDLKRVAFDKIFAKFVRDLHKFVIHQHRLGADCFELVKFCDRALQHSYLAVEDEEARALQRSDVRQLIDSVQSLIMMSDEGSNANDSDDVSEISSTPIDYRYKAGTTPADPIEL